MKKLLLSILLPIFTAPALNKLPAKPILFVDFDKVEQKSLEYIRIQHTPNDLSKQYCAANQQQERNKISSEIECCNIERDIFLKRLKLVCREIARKMDAIAVTYSANLVVFYVDPKYDITESIINALNIEYNK